MAQVAQIGSKAVFSKTGGLYGALKIAHPNHLWERLRFEIPNKKASQRWLKLKLQDILLPNTEILEEFCFKSSFGDSMVIVDIFIPSLTVAIEYLL